MRKGQKHSDTTKQKLKKSWENRIFVPWNKGKKLSPEICKKLSNAHLGLSSYWKGKTRPNETAIKISKTMTGRKLPKEHADKIRAYAQSETSFQKSNEGRMIASEHSKKRKNYTMSLAQRIALRDSRLGHSPSKETRKKISDAHRGSKHYNWKGGVTPENMKIRRSMEYREWRTAVFTRDNWTCVFCSIKGGILNADHIKPFSKYPELRFDITNGRTLCVPCHKKTDTYPKNLAKRHD